MERFTETNLPQLFDALAERDADLKRILTTFGFPPLWVRPNSFATLVLIILEQQVSLASAYAAFKKLEEKLRVITPQAVLELTDEEWRACYFSRQKRAYARGLAQAIANRQLNLESLYTQPEEEVRATLKQLKGVGDWTVDIYLIHALQRTDVFPTGDLALVNALKEVKALPSATPKETLLAIAEPWRPYRTVATLILWHYYLQKRGVKIVS